MVSSNHVRMCLICQNDLVEEAAHLKRLGYNYVKIAEVLNERYNLGLTPAAVGRHFQAVPDVQLSLPGGLSFTSGSDAELEKFRNLAPQDQMKVLNDILSETLFELILRVRDLVKKENFEWLLRSNNLASFSRMSENIFRSYIELSKLRAEFDKFNVDEMYEMIMQELKQIGGLESELAVEPEDGFELKEDEANVEVSASGAEEPEVEGIDRLLD